MELVLISEFLTFSPLLPRCPAGCLPHSPMAVRGICHSTQQRFNNVELLSVSMPGVALSLHFWSAWHKGAAAEFSRPILKDYKSRSRCRSTSICFVYKTELKSMNRIRTYALVFCRLLTTMLIWCE